MTEKIVRVRPGQERPDSGLRLGVTYKVIREDAQHYYITASGGGWYKERFEEVSDDGQMSANMVFSEILRDKGSLINSANLDHLNRIDQHFIAALKDAGFIRIKNDAHKWTVESLNKTRTCSVRNPISNSLDVGNLQAKKELFAELIYGTQENSAKETVMPSVDRKRTAMDAVRLLPNNKSYVFGGFVRDHLAGEEFKDIDIYLTGNYAKSDYIQYLKNAGFHCTFIRKGSAYALGSDVTHDVYSIIKDNNEILVDIITDPDGYGSPVPGSNWDADINQIYMRKDGSIATGFGNKSNIDQIKQKIKNKEYTPLPGLTVSRQEKLAQKGYYPTGAKRPDPKKTDEKGSTNVSDNKAQTQVTPAKATFMDKLKVNAEDAAYRVAATQMTNGTKAAILAIMTKQGQGSERISAISEMLDTEVGSALVAGLLGLSLQYAPMVSEDPRAQRLADEFQVAGMATVGNAVVGLAMEHFVPVVMGALANLPQPTKQMRVATREEEKALSSATIELEDNSATHQRAEPSARSVAAAR